MHDERPPAEHAHLKTEKATRMCADCGTAYEKDARVDGSVMEAMLWAARRSRWYAQRRKRRT